jgi:hypothetical protein
MSKPTDIELRQVNGETFGAVLTYGNTKVSVSLQEALCRDLTVRQRRFLEAASLRPWPIRQEDPAAVAVVRAAWRALDDQRV